MRAFSRMSLGAVLLASVAATGCFPDQNAASDNLIVELEFPPSVVFLGGNLEMFLGDTVVIGASLDMVGGGGEISSATFEFTSSDPSQLLVTDSGQLIAVNAGTPTLTVEAVGFEGVNVASQPVLVHGALEINSLAPTAVSWGDTVVISGVGLNEAVVVFIGTEPVQPKSYLPQDPGKPQGYGDLVSWVPLADDPAGVQVASSKGFQGAGQLSVNEEDLWERNEIVPSDIPFPYFNPFLAFEALADPNPRDTTPAAGFERYIDFYRIDIPVTSDVSVQMFSEIESEAQSALSFDSETWFLLVSDSLYSDSLSPNVFFIADSGWTFGAGAHICGFSFFTPFELSPKPVFALGTMAPGTYYILSVFPGVARQLSQSLRYVFRVADSYISPVPRDAAEENDYCWAAPELDNHLGTPLSLDIPHDPDWYAVTVAAPPRFLALQTSSTDPTVDVDLWVKDKGATPFPIGFDVGWGGSFNFTAHEVWAEELTQDALVFVQDFVAQAGPYTIFMPTELEPNDSAAVADTIAPAPDPNFEFFWPRDIVRVQAAIDAPGDRDFYTVWADSGSRLDFDIDAGWTAFLWWYDVDPSFLPIDYPIFGEDPSMFWNPQLSIFNLTDPNCGTSTAVGCSKFDAVILLYDGAGNLVAGNDDDPGLGRVCAASGFDPLFCHNGESRVLYDVPASGWYTLEVVDFFDWCCAIQNGGPDYYYILETRRFAPGGVPPVAPFQAPPGTYPKADDGGVGALDLRNADEFRALARARMNSIQLVRGSSKQQPEIRRGLGAEGLPIGLRRPNK